MKKLLLLSLITFILNTGTTAQHTFDLTPKTKLIIEQGDITHCSAAAIVNAANDKLAGGAGVCGAIFKAAGWDMLQAACDRYPAVDGIRCPTGQACITPSFNLTQRGIHSIIHAVGPDCRIIHNEQEQNTLLMQTYTASLTVADQHKAPSIAFPFISSAIFAFPRERAAHVALQAIKDYAQNTQLQRIHCVLFSQADYDLFLDTAHKQLAGQS